MMYRLILSLLLLPSLLLSVDSHAYTTADQWTGELKLTIDGESVVVNLGAPGVRYRKDQHGALVYLEYFRLNFFKRIVFFSQERGAEERVHSVSSFEQLGDQLLLSGRSMVFDRGQVLRSSQSWEKGKLHGSSDRWDHNGILIEHKEFEHGFPVGVWESYYDSGELATQTHFPESRQLWLDTALSGAVRDETTVYGMTYHHPIKGKEIWFDAQGNKQAERELLFSMDGNRWKISQGGEEKHYTADGELQAVITRSFGKRLVKKNYPLPGGGVLRKREEWIGGELFRETELRRRR